MNAQKVIIITCPESGEYLVAAKAWQSSLPNGQPVCYAQFKLHHHGGQECVWSYLVVAVQPK